MQKLGVALDMSGLSRFPEGAGNPRLAESLPLAIVGRTASVSRWTEVAVRTARGRILKLVAEYCDQPKTGASGVC